MHAGPRDPFQAPRSARVINPLQLFLFPLFVIHENVE
jgi:hypothetical protein